MLSLVVKSPASAGFETVEVVVPLTLYATESDPPWGIACDAVTVKVADDPSEVEVAEVAAIDTVGTDCAEAG